LVMATGRPRHSMRSRCSIEAKKAFMSTSAIARGQSTGGWVSDVISVFLVVEAFSKYCNYIQYYWQERDWVLVNSDDYYGAS
jgi:hypothetical protein